MFYEKDSTATGLGARQQLHWTNNHNYQFQHSWGPEGSQLFWNTTGVLLSPCCQWQGGGKEPLTKKKKIWPNSQAWRYSAAGSDTANSEKQLVQKVHTWPQEPGWAFTCRWQVLSFAHFAVLSKKKVKATQLSQPAYLPVYPPSLLRPCGTAKKKHNLKTWACMQDCYFQLLNNKV